MQQEAISCTVLELCPNSLGSTGAWFALYSSFMLTKRIVPTLFGRLTQPIGIK